MTQLGIWALVAVLTCQPSAISAPSGLWELNSMGGLLVGAECSSAWACRHRSIWTAWAPWMACWWWEADSFLGRKGWFPGEFSLSNQGQPEALEPGCQFWMEAAAQSKNLRCFFLHLPMTTHGPISTHFIHSEPIKTPDSARLSQTSGLLAVGRNYPLQVSSTPWDNLSAERSYPPWFSFPLRAGHPWGWPTCRKELPILDLLRAVLSLNEAPLHLAHLPVVRIPHSSWMWDRKSGTAKWRDCKSCEGRNVPTYHIVGDEERRAAAILGAWTSGFPEPGLGYALTPCLGLCGSWHLWAFRYHHIPLVQVLVPAVEAACSMSGPVTAPHRAGTYASTWSCLPIAVNMSGCAQWPDPVLFCLHTPDHTAPGSPLASVRSGPQRELSTAWETKWVEWAQWVQVKPE